MNDFVFDVGAERACFTRPPFHAERDTYLLPPPPILVGVLHAFHWELDWRRRELADYVIDKIQVLSPLRQECRHFIGATKRFAFHPINTVNVLGRTRIHTVYMSQPRYRVWAHVIGDNEAIIRRGYHRLLRAIREASPNRVPRLGTRTPISFMRLSDDVELPPPAGLPREIMLYDFPVDKIYDPFGRCPTRWIHERAISVRNGILTFPEREDRHVGI
jgi:CRISPR-associated Cas5-like protein